MAALGLAFLLTGCGVVGQPTAATPQPPTPPPRHTIVGTFTLATLYSFSVTIDGRECIGNVGYGDITAGTGVTLRDGSGTIIGTSSLGAGAVKADPAYPSLQRCEFPFTITDVPEVAFYGVEVSHRGQVTYSLAQMKASGWTVALGLQ